MIFIIIAVNIFDFFWDSHYLMRYKKTFQVNSAKYLLKQQK